MQLLDPNCGHDLLLALLCIPLFKNKTLDLAYSLGKKSYSVGSEKARALDASVRFLFGWEFMWVCRKLCVERGQLPCFDKNSWNSPVKTEIH